MLLVRGSTFRVSFFNNFGGVRAINDALGRLTVDPGKADIQASLNEIVSAIRAQVHFGVDGDIGR